MTHKTKQIEQKHEVLGWLIALQTVIGGFLQSMFPQFMSITAVIWFNTIFFVFLCFWDRNLLKTQDSWEKNKIAWGWCLFSPVYLYKRARVLKESLLKFWICLVSFIFSMIYAMIISNQFASAIQSIYKDCTYELSRYGADKDKTEDICWSKQMIFNQCVDNLIKNGNVRPGAIVDICNEQISKINICAQTITKESNFEIGADTAFEICICFSIYDKQYCFNKYGITE